MKAAFALSALVGLVAADGVTSKISPTASAPSSCATSYAGQFEISVVQVSTESKRDSMPVQKRSTCGGEGILVMSVTDGVATDAQGRTGYIASNYQFQFDEPAQAGAIYTAGFSVCSNGSLALGGSNVFWECKSGTFYNLYDRNWAEQCEPVEIVALPCGDDSSDPLVTVAGDGQIVGTTVAQTTIVTTLHDGQPQVITTTTPIPLCQITDGQLQVATTPCASITVVSTTSTSAAKATTTAVPVSQYSDGQIQVTPPGTIAPVSSTAIVVSTTAVASSAPAGSSATAAGSSPAASGSSAAASGTVATASGSASTLITSAASTTAASKTSSAAASGTSSTAASSSSVAASGASRVASSVGALLVGVLGAFVCL